MNHKTNLGIRAVLHTARKWKKDLAGVLPAPGHYHPGFKSGLAIADAQEEQAEELRGVTGTSLPWNETYLPEVGQAAMAAHIALRNLFQMKCFRRLPQ